MQQRLGVPGPGPPSLDTVRKTLASYELELRKAGVRHMAVIGSVARGDAIAGSDIDVLVELEPQARVSLFDPMGIELRLTDIFKQKSMSSARTAFDQA